MTSSAASMVIRDATPQDAAEVTSVLAAAFVGSPLARWLAPHRHSHERDAREYVAELVAQTVIDGSVRVVEDAGEIVGAGLWCVPSPGSASSSPLPACVPATGLGSADLTSGTWARRLRFARLAQTRRPQHRPHHVLTCLGVHPKRQRQGIGSYLLIGHHALLHVTRKGAYTVTDDSPRRDLLVRHGYTDIGPPQLLPGGVPIWSMWRPPGPADPH